MKGYFFRKKKAKIKIYNCKLLQVMCSFDKLGRSASAVCTRAVVPMRHNIKQPGASISCLFCFLFRKLGVSCITGSALLHNCNCMFSNMVATCLFCLLFHFLFQVYFSFSELVHNFTKCLRFSFLFLFLFFSF